MTIARQFSLPAVWLELRLLAMRAGPVLVLGAALCFAALLASALLLPGLRGQHAALQAELAHLQQALLQADGPAVAPPLSTGAARAADFYDSLGDPRYVEQQVKTLFAIAAQTGLRLDQAEYKTGGDAASATRTYQITLPVSGNYAAIRTFCAEVLLDIPFASLDEMSFKRESVSANAVEAKLRFTLYLAEPKGLKSPMAQSDRSAN